MQLPKGGMGHHHETMDHRDPEQVSVSSPESVLYDGSSAIVRANSALLYRAGRSGFTKIPGIVTILKGDTHTSSYVFSPSVKKREDADSGRNGAPWKNENYQLRAWIRQLSKLATRTDPRTGAIRAADCAERVLPSFEGRYPEDNRPRVAIEALRA